MKDASGEEKGMSALVVFHPGEGLVHAHADLGLNWSITLEMRKGHELIVHGVYRRIRHPMYAAIFLFAVAQA